jgi:hypothetical protein
MRINEIIIQKINRGELVTAEMLISSLTIKNNEIKDYWQQKYDELSAIAIMEVR